MPTTRSRSLKRAREDNEADLQREVQVKTDRVTFLQEAIRYVEDKQARRLNGVYKFTSDEGTRCEVSFVNNMKEGPCRYLTGNGVQIETNFKADKEEGWETVTSPHGHRVQRFYVAGVKQGIEFHQHTDGSVSLDNIVDGVQQGRSMMWLRDPTAQEAVHIVTHGNNGEQRSSIVYKFSDGVLLPMNAPGIEIRTEAPPAQQQAARRDRLAQLSEAIEKVQGKVSEGEFLSLYNAARDVYRVAP